MLNKNDNAVQDLIYLLSCAVNQIKPDDERISRMDLSAVYTLSKRHSLTACTAVALEAAGISDSRFAYARALSLRRAVLFEAERAKVFRRLEECKIRYMPLKGAVLQKDYPVFGMREMGDTDVLCDPGRMADIKTEMERLGYECTAFELGAHDKYLKAPDIEFEMHRYLIDKRESKALCAYYADVSSRLIPDEGAAYACHFRPEDFYIYLLAHEYKHFIYAGTGLRSLLDVYVFLKAHGDTLDDTYLNGELEKAGLRDFEKMNRELALDIFTEGKLSDEARGKLSYFLSSGTYGTVEQYERNDLALSLGGDSFLSKLRFVLRRILIHGDELEEKYPFFFRFKVLLPFLWIARCFRAVFVPSARSSARADWKKIKEFKS